MAKNKTGPRIIIDTSHAPREWAPHINRIARFAVLLISALLIPLSVTVGGWLGFCISLVPGSLLYLSPLWAIAGFRHPKECPRKPFAFRHVFALAWQVIYPTLSLSLSMRICSIDQLEGCFGKTTGLLLPIGIGFMSALYKDGAFRLVDDKNGLCDVVLTSLIAALSFITYYCIDSGSCPVIAFACGASATGEVIGQAFAAIWHLWCQRDKRKTANSAEKSGT